MAGADTAGKPVVRLDFPEVSAGDGGLGLIEVDTAVEHALLLLVHAHHPQVPHQFPVLPRRLVEPSVVRRLRPPRIRHRFLVTTTPVYRDTRLVVL